MRGSLSLALLLLLLPAGLRAECPATRGDLAPGELITGVDPPLWIIAGDEAVNVGDVIALLRATVDLQELRWNSPSAACPPVPGDFAPGELDESTDPPTWRPDPDAQVNVGDVIALLRVTVDVQQLGAGVTECVHEVDLDWTGQAPRSATDRRCPVGLSADVTATVVPFDQLNEEGFQIDRYTVTYENVTRGGADEPGVDVPQPIDALLFLDPGQPTYSQTERLTLLDEAAKLLPPLNSDFFFASGPQTFEATLTVYGHSLERPDAVCTGSLTHRFQVVDSGPDTVPAEDPACISETEQENP